MYGPIYEAQNATFDSAGIPFDPNACAHAYGYDGSGNLITDTVTEAVTGFVRIKTYTYTGTQMTAESAWVKQ